jgi:hypothetical protein
MILPLLTPEQQLMVLTSRKTFSEETLQNISELVQKPINWFEFTKYALYHKTLTLCWMNIRNICPKFFPNQYLIEIFNYIELSIAEQNKLYMSELKRLQEKFKQKQIHVIPVKGAMFIPMIYGDTGSRYVSDLDFLIRYEDQERLDACLKELGYIQGSYNPELQIIEPISRTKALKWKVGMSNFYPYRRLTGNKKIPYLQLDFRFSLDDSLAKESVNEIIEYSAATNGKNYYAHLFTHLCTHFFGEAKHTLTIWLGKDFNIIKLCDIRETVLTLMNEHDLKASVAFAKRFGLQKAIYYTVYHLMMIYNDGYEEEVLQACEIDDINFLETYSDGNSFNNENVFKKALKDRLFSCGNHDELDDFPQYLKL